MIDYEKTNDFIRNANAFSELLLEFLHDLNGAKAMPFDLTFDRLKDLKNKTHLKGEELAEEVRAVCPDMKDLQYYFDEWAKRLDLIDTGFVSLEDNISSSEWACKFDDDQKGLALFDIIRAMSRNYEDLISGRAWLAKTYCLKDDHQELAEQEQTQSQQQQRHKVGDFSGLIQYSSKKKLLKRLHKLIDGKGGADVGSVIRKAVDQGYLRKEPTKADFESEFELKGSWQAIHNYFHFEGDNGKLKMADQIVIF